MAGAKAIQKTVKKAVKNSAKKVVKKVVKKTTSLATDLKYEKFCVEYRKNGGNATAAAIAAGYSERTAAQQGARLLRNVKVAPKSGTLIWGPIFLTGGYDIPLGGSQKSTDLRGITTTRGGLCRKNSPRAKKLQPPAERRKLPSVYGL